jgi:methionyl-tRNA formyltransferase
MILSSETPIEETENAGQLHDRLMDLGSKTVIASLEMIEKGPFRHYSNRYGTY